MKIKYLLLFVLLCVKAIAFEYPQAQKCDQVDRYFDVAIADPYRWLENPDDLKTKDWIQAQNQLTHSLLSSSPARAGIKNRYTELLNYERVSAPYQVGESLLYFKNDGLQNQSVLYLQRRGAMQPLVFFDPNTFSESGIWSVKDVVPSPDGRFVALSVSKAGTDKVTIRIMDVTKLTFLDDRLEEVKFSNIVWRDDGFYYNRLHSKESHSLFDICYHCLQTSQTEDKIVVDGSDFAEYFTHVRFCTDTRFLFLYAWKGASNSENGIWIKDLTSDANNFQPLFTDFSSANQILDCFDGKLLLLTNYKASNQRIVLVDLANPAYENWTEVIGEKGCRLAWASFVSGKILACYLKNAAHQLLQYDLQGKFEHELPLPEFGSINTFRGYTNLEEVYFTFTSFTTPSMVYCYNVASKQLDLWHPVTLSFDPALFETKQHFYSSKDGTQIPLFIIHKKKLALDGTAPTLLYGYGGFGINMSPSFNAARILLLEQNGVLAIPILRGGAEYGESWHDAGKLFNKQNVFDDFIAAAEFLIAERYTSKERLAINGGSNGGLLVGACLTQRPDLFAVAIPEVGVLDMLRFHLFTIGKHWVPEYGSSDDPDHFYTLLDYSPLHCIQAGVDYPATLIMTGDHDDRVVPAHSYKFAATLQEKASSTKPVLLRVETDTGHGAGKPLSKIIEEETDLLTFLFWQTGAQTTFD